MVARYERSAPIELVNCTLLMSIAQVLDGNVSVILPTTVDTIDLSQPFSNVDTSIWDYIYKNGTSGYVAPTLNDGSIFATSSSLYLFGGALSTAPGAPTVPPGNGISEYAMNSSLWGQVVTAGDPVERAHYGMAVQSSTRSLGYYVGGAITPKSDPNFNALPNAMPYMVQGLITMVEQTMILKNYSSTAMNADGTAAGGFVALIDSLGTIGVIITFGGFTNVPGEPMSLGDDNLVDPSLHWDLGNVSIYDIGSQKWYQQAATGDVPPWRYNGCSVVVSAPDQSSHSIYVFGGWGNSFEESDGYVYVLSIPSFRWIRVNQDSNRRVRNHCGLIGNHTMLVVGGIQPNGEDLQPLDATGCDTSAMFTQGLGMFSLNNHAWNTTYDPLAGSATYTVHSSITNVIGGNENGSATLQTPEGGFSQQALGTLLQAHPGSSNAGSPPASAPHNDTSPKSGRAGLSNGTIAGIVLAVSSLTSVLTLSIFLLRRCYRRRHRERPRISKPIILDRKSSELHATIVLQELSDRKFAAHELGWSDRPLPPAPYNKKTTTFQVQEVEGGGSGVRTAELDSRERDPKKVVPFEWG